MSTHMPSLFDDEYMQSVRPAGEEKASGEKKPGKKEPAVEEPAEPGVIPTPGEPVTGDMPALIEETEAAGTPGSAECSIEDIAVEAVVEGSTAEIIPGRDQQERNDTTLQEDIHIETIQADYFAFVEQEKPKKKSGIFFEPAPAVIKKEKEPEATEEQEVEEPGIIANKAAEATGSIEVAMPSDEEQVEAEKAPAVREAAPSLPDWQLEEKYYGIGEVSKLFGVNISHIRFWTTEFGLKPRTTRKGDRLYSKQDIEKLRLIYHLVKEKKHTIKGAKEKLKTQKKTVSSHLDLKDALEMLRRKLVELKDQL